MISASRLPPPPEGHQIGTQRRRAPGNTILNQPYRRRVPTDRLSREDSQLAASLEGNPGPTPAGKTSKRVVGGVYGHRSSADWASTDMFANIVYGWLDRRNAFSRSRLRIWSRGTGSAVPSRGSPPILHTQADQSSINNHQSSIINMVFTHGIPPTFTTAFIYLYHQPPSSQSRVYQVKQLRTDDVYRRVVLKVVPVTDVAFSGIIMNQLMCASLFLHRLLV